MWKSKNLWTPAIQTFKIHLSNSAINFSLYNAHNFEPFQKFRPNSAEFNPKTPLRCQPISDPNPKEVAFKQMQRTFFPIRSCPLALLLKENSLCQGFLSTQFVDNNGQRMYVEERRRRATTTKDTGQTYNRIINT